MIKDRYETLRCHVRVQLLDLCDKGHAIVHTRHDTVDHRTLKNTHAWVFWVQEVAEDCAVITQDHVVACATVYAVIAVIGQSAVLVAVDIVTTDDVIIASIAKDHVVTSLTQHGIVARPCDDRVITTQIGSSRRPRHKVKGARCAKRQISDTDDAKDTRIVTKDQVIVGASADCITACATKDDVTACTCGDDIIATVLFISRYDLIRDFGIVLHVECHCGKVADHDVVAIIGPGGFADIRSNRICACATHNDIAAQTGHDRISATISGEQCLDLGQGHWTGLVPSVQRIDIRTGDAPCVTQHQIVARARVDHVVACTADDDVRPVGRCDKVTVAIGREHAFDQQDMELGTSVLCCGQDAASVAKDDGSAGPACCALGVDRVNADATDYNRNAAAQRDRVIAANCWEQCRGFGQGDAGLIGADIACFGANQTACVADDDAVAVACGDGVATDTAKDDIATSASLDHVGIADDGLVAVDQVQDRRAIRLGRAECHEHAVACDDIAAIFASVRSDQVRTHAADNDVVAVAMADHVTATNPLADRADGVHFKAKHAVVCAAVCNVILAGDHAHITDDDIVAVATVQRIDAVFKITTTDHQIGSCIAVQRIIAFIGCCIAANFVQIGWVTVKAFKGNIARIAQHDVIAAIAG